MSLDRTVGRLRLAKGSHQLESGKGCAMNAVSYMNGDTVVTDFPACSARPLAAFVQWCNDVLAGPDGYLSPEDSLLALDLAWLTVGTADVSHTAIHAWVAELLVNPTWGVIGYAENDAAQAIYDIARLHRGIASGDGVAIGAWVSADRAARAAGRRIDRTINAAGLYAVRAAHQSTAPINSDHDATLDAVTGHALRAHRRTAAVTDSAHAIEVARHAISSWRRLAGLANVDEIDSASVEAALQRIWVLA